MTLSLWLLMLSSVLASLTFGVLLAYACCLAMFRAFRIHAKQVMAQRRSLEEPTLVPPALTIQP